MLVPLLFLVEGFRPSIMLCDSPHEICLDELLYMGHLKFYIILNWACNSLPTPPPKKKKKI